MLNYLFAALLLLTIISYYLGQNRSVALANGHIRNLHSLPSYYGFFTALWCGVPAILIFAFWVAGQQSVIYHLVVASLPAEVAQWPAQQLDLFMANVKNIVNGNIASVTPDAMTLAAIERYKELHSLSTTSLWVLALVAAISGMAYGWLTIAPKLRARNGVESAIKVFMVICSVIAILTTIGIVLSVLFESILFFQKVPWYEFFFGLSWSPQMAIRPDQTGATGAFGAVPLFAGTLLIATIAMVVAVPIGLMSALYLSEYASRRFRAIAKPLLEILAGIPTVVYGFFAALTMAPFFRDTGGLFGLNIASESALAAGLVMGIMIIPFISSLSDDVINAVPQSMRDGSYALGATRSETIRLVIFPAALPGIVGSILLAVSRAIGETMIVVMAAGLAANLTLNPFEAVTTITVQIATLLVGDQEFDSPKTLAVFALGLVLFFVTLILNVIALTIVRKYREQYE